VKYKYIFNKTSKFSVL